MIRDLCAQDEQQNFFLTILPFVSCIFLTFCMMSLSLQDVNSADYRVNPWLFIYEAANFFNSQALIFLMVLKVARMDESFLHR